MITKVSKYAFSPAQTVQLCGLGDLLAVVGDDLVVRGDLVVGHQLVVELLVLVLGAASNATNDTLGWFKKCKVCSAHHTQGIFVQIWLLSPPSAP